MRSRAVLPLAVPLFLVLGGCARWKASREAEDAVRTYNEALVVAYRTNDPRGMAGVAGPDEVRKLTALIDLKRNANLALESRLEELEILGVETGDRNGITVRTRERWRYWDRALKPGMPTGQIFVANMWMTWTLGREAGRLKVLRGRTERSEYLEPKGFRPGSDDERGRSSPGTPPAREES